MKGFNFVVLELIYNFILGFWTPIYFQIIMLFITNNPKGESYYTPENESGLNMLLAFILLMVYILLSFFINVIFFKNKKILKGKIVKVLPIISNFLGIIVYVIFNL